MELNTIHPNRSDAIVRTWDQYQNTCSFKHHLDANAHSWNEFNHPLSDQQWIFWQESWNVILK